MEENNKFNEVNDNKLKEECREIEKTFNKNFTIHIVIFSLTIISIYLVTRKSIDFILIVGLILEIYPIYNIITKIKLLKQFSLKNKNNKIIKDVNNRKKMISILVAITILIQIYTIIFSYEMYDFAGRGYFAYVAPVRSIERPVGTRPVGSRGRY